MPSLVWSRRSGALLALLVGIAVLSGCSEEELPGGDCLAGECGLSGGTTATTGETTGTPTTTVGAPVGQSQNGLPCEVERIVQTRCASCHSDPPVATYMPLLTQAHFVAPATTDTTRTYAEVAIERVNSTTDPMPPRTSPQLTAEEKATLTAWLEQGAPYSNEVCASGGAGDGGVTGGSTVGTTGTTTGTTGGTGGVVVDVDTSGLECYQFLAHANGDKSSKFDVGIATDAYFNMVFDAPWEGTVYGLVIKPIIDNSTVLHHWLLYRQPGAGSDGQVSASSGAHSDGELIGGWAPGGTAMDFRRHGDVAFELPDTTYLMEFHYNSGDPAAQDASGVEVCVQREAPENLASMSWLGYDHGAESYAAGAALGGWASGGCLFPSDRWEGTCDPGHAEPIHLLFIMPHMHEKGVHMKSVVNGPNGQRTLHDMPFDFDYQVAYETDEVLMPGETITTVCDYSAPSCAGQATSAEMCYLFTYAWPAGALTDDGPWGTTAHGDNVCLGQ